MLDLTLARSQPVSKLLVQVLNGPAKLSPEQCRLLAYYSWDQDQGLLAGHDKAAAFAAMADACPAEAAVERSMLLMTSLGEVVAAARSGEHPVPLSDEQKAAARELVGGVLADPALVRANLFPIIGSGARITAAITAPGTPERAALQDRFVAVLRGLQDDTSLFTTERLYSTSGLVDFERIDDPQKALPPDLLEDVQRRVAQADAATTDSYERQTVINAASYVLEDAGLKEEARRLLLAEVDKSKQPYYFMVGIADLEQEAGHPQEALDWLKRAYDASTGPATRFQWGTHYVNGLIEMAPDDVQRIQVETVNVVRELENGRAFYQRPRRQLERLQQKLEGWASTPERQASLQVIRRDVLAICDTIPKDEAARATCEGFLATA